MVDREILHIQHTSMIWRHRTTAFLAYYAWKQFKNNEEVETECTVLPRSIQESLGDGIQKCTVRWDSCIAKEGDYVEK